MLYIVLILVIFSFGLLVASLITSSGQLPWISLGVSVLAAVVLFIDWRIRHRAGQVEIIPGASGPTMKGSEKDGAAEETAGLPGNGRSTSGEFAGVDDSVGERLDPDREPDEENTEVADLLVISELQVEVRVIDEHPRYHLSQCRWLDGRPTLALAMKEARELGFTPCAVCTPDAMVAARYRGSHIAGQE